MKQKDWILILVVGFFAGVVSLLLSNILISPASERKAQVEVVSPITSEFQEPDNRFFNTESINPTQPIRIGEAENPQPFSEGQN